MVSRVRAYFAGTQQPSNGLASITSGARLAAVVIVAGAAIGAAGSVVGLVASWWAMAGETPAFVFERFETLRLLRSGELHLGLRFEYWTLLWFTSIGAIGYQAHRGLRPAWRWVLFLSGVLLTALCGARAGNANLMIWPLNAMTAGSVGLLLGVSMTFDRVTMGAGGAKSRVTRGFVIVAGVCLAAMGYFVRDRTQAVPGRLAAENNFTRWYDQARNQLRPDLGAPLTVEVFNDFQCQFCAASMPRIRTLVDTYRSRSGRDVRLRVRDFPLDTACNSALAFGPHPAACEAAALARFTDRYLSPKLADEARAWLYLQGDGLSTNRIRSYLDERGLIVSFDRARPELLEAIRADIIVGLELGVRSTPTIVVDGVRLPNHVYLETALRASVASTGG